MKLQQKYKIMIDLKTKHYNWDTSRLPQLSDSTFRAGMECPLFKMAIDKIKSKIFQHILEFNFHPSLFIR